MITGASFDLQIIHVSEVANAFNSATGQQIVSRSVGKQPPAVQLPPLFVSLRLLDFTVCSRRSIIIYDI